MTSSSSQTKATQDILSLSSAQLAKAVADLGEPAFRADQIFQWLHEKQVQNFQQMTNLSLPLREKLEDNFYIPALLIQEKQVSKLDGTIKYLFQLPDGNSIETVVMQYQHGTSLCISTQVGCKMGCTFCASTLGGLVRNLTASEMLEQVYKAEQDTGTRVDNIVLMGIGEPLDNFDNVLRFLELVSHPKGKNLSLRSITISTCGVVDTIYKLADQNLPVTLSISLHAVTDEERKRTMPVARQWSIAELLAAADYYFDKTGRRITYEYALIEGENDSPAHAEALAKLLEQKTTGAVHVNLIPINPARGLHQRSSAQTVKTFQNILTDRHISATIRRELGSDIAAACGQLRHQKQEK